MNFNWIFNNDPDQKLNKQTIELEYQLRTKITQFLMKHLDNDQFEDFSEFHFDVDLSNQRIAVSKNTPREYWDMIKKDFDHHINGWLDAKAIT